MQLFDQTDSAGATDVGVRRSHNQDAFAIQRAATREAFGERGHFFLVSDGMGGHAVGEKASAKAVQEIPLVYTKYAAGEGVPSALRKSFKEANAAIHGMGASTPEFRGMGTTSTALVIHPDGAWLAHVGDSRLLRVRSGKVEQLSYDHSYAWEMARRLRVNPDDLRDVKRNVIIRSLGPEANVAVDVDGPYPVEPGDVYVLCSDGLSNVVAPEEVGAITSAFGPEEAVRILIELANLRGGPDNITAIIARVGSPAVSVSSTLIELPRRKRLPIGVRLRTVPWPVYVLSAALVLVAVYIWLMIEKSPLAILGLIVALFTLAVGIGGLIWTARRDLESLHLPSSEEIDESPPGLKVWREHPCAIHAGLIERTCRLAEQVGAACRDKHVPHDDLGAKKLIESAKALLDRAELVEAFRQAFRALHLVGSAFNRSRKKIEGFKPKWEEAKGD